MLISKMIKIYLELRRNYNYILSKSMIDKYSNITLNIRYEMVTNLQYTFCDRVGTLKNISPYNFATT